jgi:hypothetical protein
MSMPKIESLVRGIYPPRACAVFEERNGSLIMRNRLEAQRLLAELERRKKEMFNFVIDFIDSDGKVSSQLHLTKGKPNRWVHFDENGKITEEAKSDVRHG